MLLLKFTFFRHLQENNFFYFHMTRACWEPHTDDIMPIAYAMYLLFTGLHYGTTLTSLRALNREESLKKTYILTYIGTYIPVRRHVWR